MEYLDERFPHPPLMPVDPVGRAKARLLLHRLDKDWYSALDALDRATGKRGTDKARKDLLERLTALLPLFSQGEYIMGDDLTLVDCTVMPVLWRLAYYGVKLPKSARLITAYADRMLARPGFRNSLTDAESEMRDA